MRNEIETFLKSYPAFRERRNKAKWLGCMVLKRYGIELTPKLKDQMADLVTDLMNGDRAWRQILEDQPDLRGNDYSTKDAVEVKKLGELGYQPKMWNESETLSEFMERP